ncbi:MAG: S49 family peptidase [Burkholderiaceae bacterium]|nr:S49 family peptidase [Burkholderiaceae bacterium]
MEKHSGGKDPADTQALLVQMCTDLHMQQIALREEQRISARQRKSERRWNLGFKALLILAPIMAGGVFIAYTSGASIGPMSDVVGVVHIKGEIAQGTLAGAEKVVPALEDAFANPRVKQVVLAIDSPGGAPAEAERITQAILMLKEKYPKPVTAIIGNMGASAAYMTAMYTDRIMAGKYSLVGSIGAIIAPWQLDKAMARFHVSQRVYASGKLKAFLNPFTPVSRESDAKAKQLVSHVGLMFAKELAWRRGPHLKPDVDYSTGEVWSGEEAKAIGLVDEIGSLESLVREAPNIKPYNFGPTESAVIKLASAFGRSVAENMLPVSFHSPEGGLR